MKTQASNSFKTRPLSNSAVSLEHITRKEVVQVGVFGCRRRSVVGSRRRSGRMKLQTPTICRLMTVPLVVLRRHGAARLLHGALVLDSAIRLYQNPSSAAGCLQCCRGRGDILTVRQLTVGQWIRAARRRDGGVGDSSV